MLSPEYLLRISEGGEEIAERLHQDILDRIVERITLRLDRGDGYILTAQDKWQIEVLQDAGLLREDIEKEIAKATGLMQTEIAEAMEDAGVKAIDYDNAIYRAAGLSPLPLEQSPYLIRLMQRTYEATVGEWVNFTRTTADGVQQAFIQACDKAYTQVASGSLGYSQAFLEAINAIIDSGATVTYPSGHTDTIETATLRCIRTGISQATAQITDARMDEMNWDTILVSAHLGARVNDKQDFTNHYWWQGKFYSKSGNDKRFPPYSVCGEGNVQGIHGANCRHSHGPGDGEFNPYDQYDSEENRREFELQQRQRTMERRIRESKHEVMGLKKAMDSATTPESKAAVENEYQKAAALLQKRNKAYNDFCEENNLKKLNERITVAKWDRSQAAKARAAAKKAGVDTSVYQDYNGRTDSEQHARYRTVLGDKAPESLTAFQQMKWEAAPAWDALKKQYRVVNQYKVDSGEFTVDEILEMDERLITEKRQNFKSKYRRSGNVAGAYVDQDYYLAHSRIETPEAAHGYKGNSKLVTLRTDRIFQYIDVKKADGSLRTDTFQDTEAKLFEEFAAMYESKPFKSITMISERGMCDSCKGVMEQFKARFPDVTVRVISHKKVEGDVWKYRRRKK